MDYYVVKYEGLWDQLRREVVSGPFLDEWAAYDALPNDVEGNDVMVGSEESGGPETWYVKYRVETYKKRFHRGLYSLFEIS